MNAGLTYYNKERCKLQELLQALYAQRDIIRDAQALASEAAQKQVRVHLGLRTTEGQIRFYEQKLRDNLAATRKRARFIIDWHSSIEQSTALIKKNREKLSNIHLLVQQATNLIESGIAISEEEAKQLKDSTNQIRILHMCITHSQNAILSRQKIKPRESVKAALEALEEIERIETEQNPGDLFLSDSIITKGKSNDSQRAD